MPTLQEVYMKQKSSTKFEIWFRGMNKINATSLVIVVPKSIVIKGVTFNITLPGSEEGGAYIWNTPTINGITYLKFGGFSIIPFVAEQDTLFCTVDFAFNPSVLDIVDKECEIVGYDQTTGEFIYHTPTYTDLTLFSDSSLTATPLQLLQNALKLNG